MIKQKKNIIIGAGFSAAITKLYLGKFSRIFSLQNDLIIKKSDLIRRKEIECNKLFAKKSYSYGTLNYILKNSILHDRLTLSGNSSVWGGKIDLTDINHKDQIFFKKNNFFFKKLSYDETGTISNNKNIYQIQNYQNKILQITDLPIKINNGYLLSFIIKKIY